jgi:hypothetical protein
VINWDDILRGVIWSIIRIKGAGSGSAFGDCGSQFCTKAVFVVV